MAKYNPILKANVWKEHCLECGDAFFGFSERQRFCSNTCCLAYHNKPRPIRVEGDTAYIPLNKKFDDFAICDAQDVHLLERRNWHKHKVAGKDSFKIISLLYVNGIMQSRIYLPKLILGLNDPKMHIKYLDGDPLNNRRNNLAVLNPNQFAWSHSNRENYSTGFRGVTYKKKRGDYAARITYKNTKIFLGHFKDPTKAAIAYDVAAIKYHGEFARTNFPREDYDQYQT